jgi:hypothetical protein
MLVLFWPKSSAMCRNVRGGAMRSSSAAKSSISSELKIARLKPVPFPQSTQLEAKPMFFALT